MIRTGEKEEELDKRGGSNVEKGSDNIYYLIYLSINGIKNSAEKNSFKINLLIDGLLKINFIK